MTAHILGVAVPVCFGEAAPAEFRAGASAHLVRMSFLDVAAVPKSDGDGYKLMTNRNKNIKYITG